MQKTAQKTASRSRRHARIRARLHGTGERPRLAVFRSNRYIYAQLINDETGVTIASADSRKLSGANARERAGAVGEKIAEHASKAGVTAVVFDRGGFQYQGVIAALADGARKGGLSF